MRSISVATWPLWRAYDQGVQIVDVSAPRSPRIVANLPVPGWAVDLEVVGNLVYVAAMNSGLYVFDVSNLAQPQRIAFDRCTPLALAVRGDYAYVSDGDVNNLLRVYDISYPGAPWQVDRVPILSPRGIGLAGNYAYVAAKEHGVRVVDITNPAQPKEVGYRQLPSEAANATFAGQRLYVSGGEAGLHILETWNPQYPMLIRTWTPPVRKVPPDNHLQKGYISRPA